MRHDEWMRLAEVEYARLLDLMRGLDEPDWARPTDCAEWDVRQMVTHLVGAAESAASPREALRQARLGRQLRPGAPLVDGMDGWDGRRVSGAVGHPNLGLGPQAQVTKVTTLSPSPKSRT